RDLLPTARRPHLEEEGGESDHADVGAARTERLDHRHVHDALAVAAVGGVADVRGAVGVGIPTVLERRLHRARIRTRLGLDHAPAAEPPALAVLDQATKRGGTGGALALTRTLVAVREAERLPVAIDPAASALEQRVKKRAADFETGPTIGRNRPQR